MLLQDKTSKIEKLQQLLHGSERQRTELPIGAVFSPLECERLRSPPVYYEDPQDWSEKKQASEQFWYASSSSLA